jgi:hypothetical protein
MSSYREVAELILKLKGELFLSPRERWFLKRLEESAYPWQLVEEGIKRFYAKLPPERRKKTPAFFALGEIERLKKRAIKSTPQGKRINGGTGSKVLWKSWESILKCQRWNQRTKCPQRKFWRTWRASYTNTSGRICLRKKKNLFLKSMPNFKQDKTALSFMIKGELRKKFGLGVFSLFVEER